MKVAIISQYFYPEEFKINEIASDLVNKGHGVVVITGLPNYPSGVIPKEYRWKRRHETINGVDIYRCFIIPRRRNPLSLILNYLSFVVSAFVKIINLKKTQNIDVIFVYQLSPVTMALPAILLKKLTRKKIFLYSLDIWPESMVTMTKRRSGIIYVLVHKLSKYIYQSVDKIAVTSESFTEYFYLEHQIKSEAVSYIPQHHTRITLNENITHDGFNFLFAGNIGKSQGFEWIVQAVKMISRDFKFKIHVFGDGSERRYIEKIVSDFGLNDNFAFYGHVSQNVVNEFYTKTDVCLLTLRSETQVGRTVPSKLIGYFSAGKPIIGLVDGPARSLIVENQCGWVGTPGDVYTLADYMIESMENRKCLVEMGRNSAQLYESSFTKEVFVDRIESELKKLIGESNV